MAISWKDLSQLDVQELKNLDYKKIVGELRKQPMVLTNFVIIVVTILFSLQYYSRTQAATNAARQEIPQLEAKIKALEEYNDGKKKLQQYFEKIQPPPNGEELMNRITDFAVNHHMLIESFTPSRETDFPLYHTTSIRVSVSAWDYRHLWLFVHDIESKIPSVRVLRLEISLPAAEQPNRRANPKPEVVSQPPEGKRLAIEIEIAAVTIKKE